MSEYIMSEIEVKDAYQLIVKNPSSIGPETYLEDALKKIVDDHKTRHVYVVDKDNHLLGSIKLSSVIEYMFPQSSFGLKIDLSKNSLIHFKKSLIAMDIMNNKPSFVHTTTKLPEAVKLMKEKNIGELPVVDDDNKLVGELNILEVITYYLDLV